MLYREIGDRRGEANVLWGMGNREYFQRRPDAGEANFRAAYEMFQQVGDATMVAWSLHMLGNALLRRDRPEESRPLLREALRHFRDASDAAGIALVFDDLASQAVVEGDLARAARIRGAARRLTRATGAELAGLSEQFESGVRPHLGGRLSPEDLERYQAEGAAMTLDKAVAYALDLNSDDLGHPAYGTDEGG